MKTIKDYIKTLTKKDLNTNKISLVIHDKRMGYYLYLFKINLKENSCIMMNSPSDKYSDYKYIELTSLSLCQLENEYGACEIIKTNPYIGMDYREVKKIL